MSRRLTTLILALTLVTVASTGFFYFRDNLSTHYPLKAMQAEILRGGELPMWNRASGGGQPLGGNPNSLLFYPDTLLFLLLPPLIAFNLHFLIHFVIAFFAMRALVENCGTTRENANWCAALYVVSGAAVSTAAFYNLVVPIAFVPLAASALISLLNASHSAERRRCVLQLGLSCGLLGLAAEPIILASTTLLLLLLASGPRMLRLLPQVVAAVALALVIASPLLIAYSDISKDVERSGFRYSAATVLNASLSPLRLTEVLVGPFQGTITNLDESGFGPSRGETFPQFLPSVFIGALALPAILAGWKSVSARWLLALSVLTFFALGRFNPIAAFFVESIPALRLARFPEKLVLPMTICLVVLLARLVSTTERLTLQSAFVALGVLLAVSAGTIAYRDLASIDRLRCIAGAAVGGAILLLATRSVSRALRASTLVALVVALFTLPIDWRSHYERPTLLRAVIPTGATIVHRLAPSQRVLFSPSARDQYRTALLMGDSLTGSLDGLRYVLDGSPDGMHSFLSRLARERARQLNERSLHKYMKLAGADYLVSSDPPSSTQRRAAREVPGTIAEGEISFGPNRATIERIVDPLPPLHAPARVIPASSVQEAAAAIEREDFAPGRDAVAPRTVPTSTMRLARYSESANGFRANLAAASAGTIVTRETWFRAWRVTVDGTEVDTFPVNIDRLGFVVPGGFHEVEAVFGRRNRYVVVSAFLSLLAIVSSAIAAFVSSRRAIAAPAR